MSLISGWIRDKVIQLSSICITVRQPLLLKEKKLTLDQILQFSSLNQYHVSNINIVITAWLDIKPIINNIDKYLLSGLASNEGFYFLFKELIEDLSPQNNNLRAPTQLETQNS